MSGRHGLKDAARDSGPIGRRDFLALAGASAAGLLPGCALAAERQAKRRKPNILVIISDDQGYADVGYHGCKDIPTPNIDSLAENGVRFTNGYVSCPVCSPTRAGLMTARYQQRFGHEFNTGPPPGSLREHVGLPLAEVTMADALKAAGYVTGVVGKWHLGMRPKYHPQKRGFDEFFGFQHGGHSYIKLAPDKYNPIQRGTTPIHEKEYLTDAFSREAVAFIERHKGEPFLLYLAYNDVHTPMQATQKYLDRFPNIKEKKRRTYAAMLAAMDDGIGAVLKVLREAGIEDDTLIFFLSDNGGPTRANASSNTPLRAGKGSMYEGGIRVPFVVQWKRHLPAGTAYSQPVIALDIFPTAVAAAGGDMPTDRVIDGVNLLPYLKGEKKDPPHDALFWRAGTRYALRKGNWKLVKLGNRPHELYDLSSDIAEKTNLAAEKPDVLKDLTDALTPWDAQLVKPRWEPPRRRKRRKKHKPGKRKQ
jgi:arylsulfatase A-like enzyme